MLRMEERFLASEHATYGEETLALFLNVDERHRCNFARANRPIGDWIPEYGIAE